MTYNKPNDKTYTEMCMYFDDHIYDDPEVRNDSLLYQYLYHIIYMLSCKLKLFEGPNSFRDYDEYSLWLATKIYSRFIANTDPETRLKSVLNYTSYLVNRAIVDWRKETFNDILGQKDEQGSMDKLEDSLKASIRSDYCNIGDLMDDVVTVFSHLRDITYKIIDRTPYTTDPLMRKRLAMSVLLTLVDEVTVPSTVDKRVEDTESKYKVSKKSREGNVILWRLSRKYENLVHILSVEVRKECSSLVGLARADYELSEEDVTSILMTAYGNVARDNNEEF